MQELQSLRPGIYIDVTACGFYVFALALLREMETFLKGGAQRRKGGLVAGLSRLQSEGGLEEAGANGGRKEITNEKDKTILAFCAWSSAFDRMLLSPSR